MKNKMILIIIVICILALSYIILSLFLSIIFGKKMNDNGIIKSFDSNRESFIKVVDELQYIKNVHIIRKEDYYTITLNGKEKIILTEKEAKSNNQYVNSINIMKKQNLIYLTKNNNNIEFTFNSMFAFSQSISYISNIEKYKHENSIIEMKKIDDNWYYVETE